MTAYPKTLASAIDSAITSGWAIVIDSEMVIGCLSVPGLETATDFQIVSALTTAIVRLSQIV